MRLWYLSHRWPAKAQATRNMEVDEGSDQRPKIRHLAPLDGWACVFEEWVYGEQKVPKSHELARLWLFVLRSILFPCFMQTVFGADIDHFERIFEPAHQIMALFNLCRLIRQTRMRSHPVGLHIWFLVWSFVYFHTSYVRTAKALARLTWAITGCLFDKYHNLMSWLILFKLGHSKTYKMGQVMRKCVLCHMRTTQISTFVVRCLHSIMPLVSISAISRL